MFYLSSNEHITGPYTRDELLESVKDGVINQDALIREQGSDDWQPISTLTQPPQDQAATTIYPPAISHNYPHQPPAVYHPHYHHGYRNPSTAVLLEILPGILMQTFGIGNIYAGNVAFGVTMMLTYWALTVINMLLCFVLIGVITWPLTFVLYLVFCVIYAQKGAERTNWRVNMQVSPRY